MARKKTAEVFEDRVRLSSKVLVIIQTPTPEDYDALEINRVNGAVSVALPGRTVGYGEIAYPSSFGETDNMRPSTDPAIAAARARLLGQFPDGASGTAAAPVSRAVTADELAAQAGFDTTAIQRSIAAATGNGNFAGTSNEDEVNA